MIIHDRNDIILTDNTSFSFVRNIINPNPETLSRRDAFFETLEQIIIEEHDDYFSADIPWFDISI